LGLLAAIFFFFEVDDFEVFAPDSVGFVPVKFGISTLSSVDKLDEGKSLHLPSSTATVSPLQPITSSDAFTASDYLDAADRSKDSEVHRHLRRLGDNSTPCALYGLCVLPDIAPYRCPLVSTRLAHRRAVGMLALAWVEVDQV
jgi:hypothetical protein